MRTDIPLYVNYNSFETEARATLRDTKVNLNVLMDASGENLLPAVKVGTILDQLLRSLGDEAKYRLTPDFIEIVWIGPQGGEAAWRPMRHQPKPRPEALRWLARGLEHVPESAELRLARGQIYLEQYELDAAIAEFTQVIERNPANVQAHRLRSIAYTARGKPEDASRARADALATKP
jgi:tetratricopeptide (TPR) repeat protein